ncbi:MAG: ABC transporter permease subunit [Kiloniellaceae bacterium]|nr:ABC transporter permease subunit [Kiloniellaceae bacterium]
MLAGAFVANLEFIRLLLFRMQVLVVWAELLLLFYGFALSFERDFGVIFEVGDRSGVSNLYFLITTGAFTTIYISLIAISIACVLALAGALGKLSSNGAAYAVATFYISFFRGTPLLLQVVLIYTGFAQLGFVMEAVPAGITALSLCYGAYMAEIFRAGILGVPHGQREAAKALGVPESLIFRKIVFPQAMRLIVPPTGNQFIAMLKDSSLVSVVGVWELTKTAQVLGKRDFQVFEFLIAAAVIYWIMSVVFEVLQSRLEAYYGKGDRR